MFYTQKLYKIQIDLFSSNVAGTDMVYYSGDKNAYPLEIQLTANSMPYKIKEEDTAFITFQSSGEWGNKVTAEMADGESGLLLYNIAGTEWFSEGVATAYVELQTADRCLTWQPFSFMVYHSANSTGVNPPAQHADWTKEIDAAIANHENRIGSLEAGGGSGVGTGLQGPKGDTGATGAQGLPGPKGDTGEKGDKGDKGEFVFWKGAGAHNGIYRGNYLGSAVTPEQYAAIASGTFDDLFIGDYWTIGGVNYRIAAFNYYLRCGDNVSFNTHHVVIVPDTALYNATMNATNITTGGYAGSVMRTANLEQAKTTIDAAFPGHALQHSQYFTNAVTSGRASGGAWFDSTVDLMNEVMVYGSAIFSPVSDGTSVSTNHTLGKSQLPLFALRPDLISNRLSYWLRDTVSGTHFAYVSYSGYAGSYAASHSYGVRPAFSIF